LRAKAWRQRKRRSDRADDGGLIVRDGAWDASLLVSEQIEFVGRKVFIRLAFDRGVPVVPVVAVGGPTALFATRRARGRGHRLAHADPDQGIAGRVRAAVRRHGAGPPGTPAFSGEDHRRIAIADPPRLS